MHLCFSASATHEKEEVIRAPLRSADMGEDEGGVQVATVKVSTNLRMKKRGKVPPRLETLFIASVTLPGSNTAELINIRCKQSHICPSDSWIGDLSVES